MSHHRDLADIHRHEPKGISTATANQVYRANGSGSGSWQSLTIPSGQFIVTHQVFTANGTWFKPSNLWKIVVHCYGGGGAAAGGFIGQTAFFGTYCNATGGTGSTIAGVGINGDLNVTGWYTTDAYANYALAGAGPHPQYGGGNWDGISNAGACGGYCKKDILNNSQLSDSVAISFSGGTYADVTHAVIVDQYITV